MAKKEVEVKSKVSYEEIKPKPGEAVNKDKYLGFLKIYHFVRPYLDKPNEISKADLRKQFPKQKEMAGEVWECVFDLKLKWAEEIFARLS